MIIFDAEFPKNCFECPIRAKIGCDLSYTKNGVNKDFVHPKCPFESAVPFTETEYADMSDEPDSHGGFEVAEMICLGCFKRFVDVRSVGVLLKNLECPRCHKTGLIIETGEYLTDVMDE